MAHKPATTEEIACAIMALGSGFKIEQEETALLGAPVPTLILRGPGIRSAVVTQLRDLGLIKESDTDADILEISDAGLEQFKAFMKEKFTQASKPTIAPVKPVVHDVAYVAEGHGYDIPPPVQVAQPA